MKRIYTTVRTILGCAALAATTGCAYRGGVVIYAPRPVPPPPVVVVPMDHVQQIIRRAEAGDPVAQYILGTYHLTGRGVVRSNIEAARWFRASAQRGYAPAEYRLGASYALGRGVPRNRAEAIRWCGLAASQNYAPAQRYLVMLEGQPYAAPVGVGTGAAPAPASAPAPAESNEAAAQPPLTVEEIKTLSGTGVKPDALIDQIKETNSKFSRQDIAAAQQANPPVDSAVIDFMKQNMTN